MSSRSTTASNLHRHWASEADGHGAARAKHRNQSFNSSPGTHSAACKAKANVDQCNGASEPSFLVASDPSLQAVVVSDCLACGRVEAFARKFGSLVDDGAEVHHAWEGVCKIHHKDRADEAGNAVEVGDRPGNDKCENPIAWSQQVPEDLALFLNNRGEFEDGLENFKVHRLHADVEIHDDRYPTGQKSENITGGL